MDRASHISVLPHLFATMDQARGAIMLGFPKRLMKNGGGKSFEGFRRVEGVLGERAGKSKVNSIFKKMKFLYKKLNPDHRVSSSLAGTIESTQAPHRHN